MIARPEGGMVAARFLIGYDLMENSSVEIFQVYVYLNNEKEMPQTYPGFSSASGPKLMTLSSARRRGGAGSGRRKLSPRLN